MLWLRATTGVESGLSNLVSSWVDADGLEVAQASGSRMPRWSRHGVGGRPALHFDGDDSLTRLDGMPTGDYTKVAVVTLDDYGSHNNVLSGANEHFLGDACQVGDMYAVASIRRSLNQLP